MCKQLNPNNMIVQNWWWLSDEKLTGKKIEKFRNGELNKKKQNTADGKLIRI